MNCWKFAQPISRQGVGDLAQPLSGAIQDKEAQARPHAGNQVREIGYGRIDEDGLRGIADRANFMLVSPRAPIGGRWPRDIVRAGIGGGGGVEDDGDRGTTRWIYR